MQHYFIIKAGQFNRRTHLLSLSRKTVYERKGSPYPARPSLTLLLVLVFKEVEGKEKLALNILCIACREVFVQQEGQITVSVCVNDPRLALVWY